MTFLMSLGSAHHPNYFGLCLVVCQGSTGNLEGAITVFMEVEGLFKRKNNQIELFSMKRVSTSPHDFPVSFLAPSVKIRRE